MSTPIEIKKVILRQHPAYQKRGGPNHSASSNEDSNVYYCSIHSQVFGCCYLCGLSWEAETEFFGCSNGLSVNCREGLEAEFGEGEDHLDRRIFDKLFDHEESLKYYRGDVPKEVSHYDPFPKKSGTP